MTNLGEVRNGCRIRSIVLLPLDERFYIDRWNQPNRMTFCAGKPTPEMAGRAGFHRNDAVGCSFRSAWNLDREIVQLYRTDLARSVAQT